MGWGETGSHLTLQHVTDGCLIGRPGDDWTARDFEAVSRALMGATATAATATTQHNKYDEYKRGTTYAVRSHLHGEARKQS
jgi:hypothetical protein